MVINDHAESSAFCVACNAIYAGEKFFSRVRATSSTTTFDSDSDFDTDYDYIYIIGRIRLHTFAHICMRLLNAYICF